MSVEDLRMENGKLQSFAFPGGYPIFYITKDNGVLCPDCANGENGSAATTKPTDRPYPDDYQWLIVAADMNYEDPFLYCDHCNKFIDLAYLSDKELEAKRREGCE